MISYKATSKYKLILQMKTTGTGKAKGFSLWIIEQWWFKELAIDWGFKELWKFYNCWSGPLSEQHPPPPRRHTHTLCPGGVPSPSGKVSTTHTPPHLYPPPTPSFFYPQRRIIPLAKQQVSIVALMHEEAGESETKKCCLSTKRWRREGKTKSCCVRVFRADSSPEICRAKNSKLLLWPALCCYLNLYICVASFIHRYAHADNQFHWPPQRKPWICSLYRESTKKLRPGGCIHSHTIH